MIEEGECSVSPSIQGIFSAFETPMASVDFPEPQGPEMTIILFFAVAASVCGAQEVARKCETNLLTSSWLRTAAEARDGERNCAYEVSYVRLVRGRALSYLLAKNSTSLMGGLETGSGFEDRSAATHSFWLSSLKERPAWWRAGMRSRVQWKLWWFTTFITPAPAEPREISEMVEATTSTGSHNGLSSSVGTAPTVKAACIINGMASVAFQIP